MSITICIWEIFSSELFSSPHGLLPYMNSTSTGYCNNCKLLACMEKKKHAFRLLSSNTWAILSIKMAKKPNLKKSKGFRSGHSL